MKTKRESGEASLRSCSSNMFHEIELFFLGTGTGIGLSVLFDVLRAFRKCKRHREWSVALEDLFFWLIVSGTLFGLIQYYNRGVLRFYVFLGCGLGVLCYFLTITRLLFPVFVMAFTGLKWILYKCCLIFEKILKIIKNLFILPLKKIIEGIKILCNTI